MSLMFHLVSESLWDVHMASPIDLPSVAPLVATSISVSLPLVAFCIRSKWLYSLSPYRVSHSHGPSILGPPSGNPGLAYQISFILSRNPSKGEKSEISLFSTFSHFKLVKSARGDISDMLLPERLRRVNPSNPQGAIYPILFRRQDTVLSSLLIPQGGIYPIYSPPQISISSNFVNPARADKSDIGIAPRTNEFQVD